MITRQVELIGNKEFAGVALDPEHEIFMVHIAAFSINSGDEEYSSRRDRIAHLKADKVPSEMPSKYADFADIFSLKLAVKLPEYTRIKNHAIELVDD